MRVRENPTAEGRHLTQEIISRTEETGEARCAA